MFAQHTAVSRPLGSEPGGAVVAVSPDARLVAVGFADGRIQLWDAATRQRVGPQIRQPGDGTLMSLRFSPDGRFLASGSAALTGVAIWNLPSGTLRRLPAYLG